MAQWILITTLLSTRRSQMWNFLKAIRERLARKVLASMRREAEANVMYRGSASSLTFLRLTAPRALFTRSLLFALSLSALSGRSSSF